jgi:hypothetical protein
MKMMKETDGFENGARHPCVIALIIGMASSLLLAGCPTDGGGDPSAEGLAGQLAADINKISAGSATVNGATVTLSGKLSLESQFTVPAGVTLDLTGDGELALLDAALTVNGTVNAGAQKVRMDSAATWGAINGSGTIQLKGKGRLLAIRDNRTLTLDGVTLAGVKDNDSSLVVVRSGGFIMKSGVITGNTCIGNEHTSGGGVNVYEGTFTMEGGAISGNTVESPDSCGGGVRADKSMFTMKGGVISGNTAGGGGQHSDGGGISVYRNSTFTMEGGTIYGNTTKGGGGGVHIGDSTFIMKGGTIYGKAGSLPAGVDPSFANIASDNAALSAGEDAAKWGMGGTYTKGGVGQTGGSDIGSTDDTLIAVPAP